MSRYLKKPVIKIHGGSKSPTFFIEKREEFLPHLNLCYMDELEMPICMIWGNPTRFLTILLYRHIMGDINISDIGVKALADDINTLKLLCFWDIEHEEYGIKEAEIIVEHNNKVRALSPVDRRLYYREVFKEQLDILERGDYLTP